LIYLNVDAENKRVVGAFPNSEAAPVTTQLDLVPGTVDARATVRVARARLYRRFSV
jgi:hypothetical protein